MEQFTNLYQLSKTLRFELKPIGKTLEYIKQNGLLQKDFDRAKSYIEVKKIIDEYHKNFITTSLSCLTLKFASDQNNDSISEYYSLYLISKKNDIQKKEFGTICSKLRKQIADRFTKSDIYKSIDKKELIKKHLFDFVRTDKERELITEFKDFTTYFSGFHENRKNMYSAEEKSTAIAFRLINENLPKFIDNIAVFQKLVNTDVVKDLTTIYSELHEYMNVKNIRDFFQLEYYSDLLTQLQIEVYNAIIGGKTLNDGAKIKGLNEYINLYNHKQSDKSRRLPKLKPLYKQILSDREVISFLPEEFKTDNETLESIEQFYNILNDLVLNPRDGKTYSIKSLLKDLNVFNLDKVYIQNDVQLTDLSQKTFKNWDTIQKALEYNYYIEYPQKTNTAAKYEENKNNFIKRQSRFSISYINKGLAGINTIKKIQDYFISGGVNDTQNQDIFDRIESAYSKTKDLLNTPYPEDKELSQDKANIEKVKNLLDTLKELQHFVKPLLCKEDEADKDEHFYGELVAFWKELDNITPLYNKVRNRMTRKPYLENKIKLNFENKSNFLGGWVDSKTEHSDNGTQSGGYLFRKKMI